MIAALLVICWVTLCGGLLAAAIDPSLGGLNLAGCAFLVGSGWISIALFALSAVGGNWSTPLVAALTLVPAIAIWLLARGKRRQARPEGQQARRVSPALLIDLVTVALIVGYALFATLAPLWEWDFWAIWGLKGKIFFGHGGIDWPFLQRPANRFTHPDYPLLLPLLYDAVAIAAGHWDDRWIGLLFPAFAAAAILIVRAEGRRVSGSPLIASIIALCAAGLVCNRWIGMAEAPFIAFAVSGLLLARDAIARQSPERLRLAAVVLGFGAWTKNEGLVLIAGILLGGLLQLRKKWPLLLQLWPALLIPVLWTAEKTFRHLSLDLTSGPVLDRVRLHLGQLTVLLVEMAHNPPPHPWLWLAAAASLLLAWRLWIRNESLGLVVIVVQLVAYFGALLTTPLPLLWHVQNAWSRLLGQIELMLFVMTLFALMPQILELMRPEKVDEQ